MIYECAYKDADGASCGKMGASCGPFGMWCDEHHDGNCRCGKE